MYALFEGDRQIGNPFPTEKEVWKAALIEGLVNGGMVFASDLNVPARAALSDGSH